MEERILLEVFLKAIFGGRGGFAWSIVGADFAAKGMLLEYFFEETLLTAKTFVWSEYLLWFAAILISSKQMYESALSLLP